MYVLMPQEDHYILSTLVGRYVGVVTTTYINTDDVDEVCTHKCNRYLRYLKQNRPNKQQIRVMLLPIHSA